MEPQRQVEACRKKLVNLIRCKNLCKCYSVPPPSTTLKIIKKKLINSDPRVYKQDEK
jgi:hypothetical protein